MSKTGDPVDSGASKCITTPSQKFQTREDTMALQLGDVAPDFEAETTEGRIRFHEWIGDSWAILFSHPKDFTPVCTTELGYMAKIKPEFDKRNGMLPAAVSGDPAKRTAADNLTVRNVFVIGPDKKVKLILVYPMTTGRNFDEV